MNEISIQTETIKKAISKLGVAVSTKSVLPILENILFKVSNDKTEMIASDLEMTVIYEVEIPSMETFSFLVPFRQLSNIVKLSSADQIKFHVLKNSTKIVSGSDVYELANNAEVNDFPAVQEWGPAPGITLEGIFIPYLSTALTSVATDPQKVLSKVLLSIKKDSLTIVGTDGYILYKWSNSGMNNESEQDLLLTSRAIKAMDGESEVNLEWDANKYFIASGKTKTIITKSEGKYPQYEVIIPNNEYNLKVNRKSLLLAFQKCSIATEGFKDVSLDLGKSSIKLNVKNDSKGIKVNADTDCEYSGLTPNLTLNIDNAIRMLHHADSDIVEFAIEGHNKAITMKSSDQNYLGLIIPTFNK